MPSSNRPSRPRATRPWRPSCRHHSAWPPCPSPTCCPPPPEHHQEMVAPGSYGSSRPAPSGGDLVARAKVYVTRVIPAPALDIVREAAEMRMWDREDVPPPRDVLLREVADSDGLLSLLTDRVDDELLAHAPRLRVVGNMAVGFDNIDVDAATRRGVLVSNTPDVLTETN